MVGSYQIQFREDVIALEGREVLDMWHGVAVWDGDAVERTIISAGAPVTGHFLRHHVEWR